MSVDDAQRYRRCEDTGDGKESADDNQIFHLREFLSCEILLVPYHGRALYRTRVV